MEQERDVGGGRGEGGFTNYGAKKQRLTFERHLCHLLGSHKQTHFICLLLPIKAKNKHWNDNQLCQRWSKTFQNVAPHIVLSGVSQNTLREGGLQTIYRFVWRKLRL